MRWWILQSNAARIDIAAYLAEEPTRALHGVKRYARQIALGDRVFLWRAAGGTKAPAGIVAVGTVLEPADLLAHDRTDLCRDPRTAAPKLRVALKVDEFVFIPREEIRRLPEMASHSIVTSNTGSDFALTPEQANAIRALGNPSNLP